jgi:hypothetical protein
MLADGGCAMETRVGHGKRKQNKSKEMTIAMAAFW